MTEYKIIASNLNTGKEVTCILTGTEAKDLRKLNYWTGNLVTTATSGNEYPRKVQVVIEKND